jgi:hypothetical protein
MANGTDTIIGQGSFTQPATAVNQTIMIPQGADWVEIWNYTQANQSTSAAGPNGYHFYWQRSNGANMMGDGTQGIYDAAGAAGAVTVNVTTSGAFTLYDPSNATIGAAVAFTGLSAATHPVVTASNTGVQVGSIVRLFNPLGVKQQMLGGIDFTVDVVTSTTSFDLAYLNTTGSTTGSGYYRIIPYNPLFYPRRRTITNITAASQAVITMSVDHGFTVGQKVRLSLPGGSAVWGSYAALSNYDNGQANSTTPDAYTIIAVDVAFGNTHNTITISANTTGFETFLSDWQAILTSPYTPAEVIPVGEDTSYAQISLVQQTPQVNGVQINGTNTGILADATVNTGFYGMTLQTGALLPAGVASDVIFWKAGVSSYGGLNSSTPPSE